MKTKTKVGIEKRVIEEGEVSRDYEIRINAEYLINRIDKIGFEGVLEEMKFNMEGAVRHIWDNKDRLDVI